MGTGKYRIRKKRRDFHIKKQLTGRRGYRTFVSFPFCKLLILQKYFLSHTFFCLIYSWFHASTILFIAVSMAERFFSKLEAKG